MKYSFFRIDVPEKKKAMPVKKILKNTFNDIKFLIRKRNGLEFILWEQKPANIELVKKNICSVLKKDYNIVGYNKIDHSIDKIKYPFLSRKITLRDAISLPYFDFTKKYTLFFPKEADNCVERSMTYKFTGDKILFDDKSRFFYDKNNNLLCLEDMLVSFEEIYKNRTLNFPDYIPYRKVTLTTIECAAYISALDRITYIVKQNNEGDFAAGNSEINDRWYQTTCVYQDSLPFLRLIKSDRDFPLTGDKDRDAFGIMSDGLTEDCVSFEALKSIYNLIYWQVLGKGFLSSFKKD